MKNGLLRVGETPRPNGTPGSTGVGEMCLAPTAPVAINGIKDTIGGTNTISNLGTVSGSI